MWTSRRWWTVLVLVLTWSSAHGTLAEEAKACELLGDDGETLTVSQKTCDDCLQQATFWSQVETMKWGGAEVTRAQLDAKSATCPLGSTPPTEPGQPVGPPSPSPKPRPSPIHTDPLPPKSPSPEPEASPDNAPPAPTLCPRPKWDADLLGGWQEVDPEDKATQVAAHDIWEQGLKDGLIENPNATSVTVSCDTANPNITVLRGCYQVVAGTNYIMGFQVQLDCMVSRMLTRMYTTIQANVFVPLPSNREDDLTINALRQRDYSEGPDDGLPSTEGWGDVVTPEKPENPGPEPPTPPPTDIPIKPPGPPTADPPSCPLKQAGGMAGAWQELIFMDDLALNETYVMAEDAFAAIAANTSLPAKCKASEGISLANLTGCSQLVAGTNYILSFDVVVKNCLMQSTVTVTLFQALPAYGGNVTVESFSATPWAPSSGIPPPPAPIPTAALPLECPVDDVIAMPADEVNATAVPNHGSAPLADEWKPADDEENLTKLAQAVWVMMNEQGFEPKPPATCKTPKMSAPSNACFKVEDGRSTILHFQGSYSDCAVAAYVKAHVHRAASTGNLSIWNSNVGDWGPPAVPH